MDVPANRFIKFVAFPLPKRRFALLYGYSIPSTEPESGWARKKSERLTVYTSILSPQAAQKFEEALCTKGDVGLPSNRFLRCSALVRRRPWKSYSGEARPLPKASLAEVHELRNGDQLALIHEFLAAVCPDGGCQGLKVLDALRVVKREMGVDFQDDANHFGDYLHYDVIEPECSIKVDMEHALHTGVVVVSKAMEASRPLIVNCVACEQNQTVRDQIHMLTDTMVSTVFWLPDNADLCRLRVWDARTGGVVGCDEQQGIVKGSFVIEGCIPAAPRRICDEWSANMKTSSPHRKGEIEERIETVEPYSVARSAYNLPTTASQGNTASARLPSDFFRGIGSFIVPEKGHCQIDCFELISEYLNKCDVAKAVIVDPYFNEESACKILKRISNADLNLLVITSLSDKDEYKNVAKDGLAKKLREFLYANKYLLHGHLTVLNTVRGDKQVFHCRLLHLTYRNGDVESFLLDNSLNSMGKSYPFIMASLKPLESMCLAHYIEWLQRNEEASKQMLRHDKRGFTTETLWDWRTCLVQSSTSQEVTDDCPENSLGAPKIDAIKQDGVKDVPNAEALEHGGANGTSGGTVNSVPPTDPHALRYLQETDGVTLEYNSEALASTVRVVEEQRIQENTSASRRENSLRNMLRDNVHSACVSFDNTVSVYAHLGYDSYPRIRDVCHRLLAMDRDRFLVLLAELRSPVMLSVLLAELDRLDWDRDVYRAMLETSNECVRQIAVSWCNDRLLTVPCGNAAQSMWDSLTTLERAFQATCILQGLSLAGAIKKGAEKLRSTLRPNVAKCIAAALDGETDADRVGITDALYVCEKGKACVAASFYLEIADAVTDSDIRTALVQHTLEVLSAFINSHEDMVCWSGDCGDQCIELLVRCFELGDARGTECYILAHVIAHDAFENAVDAGLVHHNMSYWSDNVHRAYWQIRLLKKICANRQFEVGQSADMLRRVEHSIEQANAYLNALRNEVSNENEMDE